MIKELFNTKTDDTVMIPLTEFEQFKADSESRVADAERQNTLMLSEAAKQIDEAETKTEGYKELCDMLEEKCDEVREAYFDAMAEYVNVIKIARDCISKKNYKALKTYIEAYDKGELFMLKPVEDDIEVSMPMETAEAELDAVIVDGEELDEAVKDFADLDDFDDFEVLFDDEE